MTKNLFRSFLAGVVLALGLPAQAQQPSNMPRIGFIRIGSPPDPMVEAFRQGLRDLGYEERKNITVEYRWTDAKPERLSALAAELVRLKLDVLVAPGSTVARAVKQANATIPVVITAIPDPVREGFVASLAQPGGNFTGLSNLSPDLSGKRLEILKETFPKIFRLAVLRTPEEEGGQMKATAEVAKTLGLKLQLYDARSRTDIETAFSLMVKSNADALIVLGSAILFEHRVPLAELAVTSRRPAMYPHVGFVDPGGLMSYGPDFPDLYRRAAIYVDKILKGRKPADLPVEQPMKFELVINLKAAKRSGLTIPPSVLARAQKVIK
jgi:putative tryptophan/tyrosine transport system substrate-binding protein